MMKRLAVTKVLDKTYLRFDLALIVARIVLVVSVAGALLYAFRTYGAYFSSDAAASNVLAEEIVFGGRFFPRDWWYVNSDIWIVFKQLFLIPFAVFGANGFKAHAIVGAVIILMLVGSCYWVLRSAGCRRVDATVSSAIPFIAFSDQYMDILFGEAGYTWTLVFLLVTMGLIFEAARREKDKFGIHFGAMLAILTALVAASNPLRYVTFYLFPLAASFGWMFLGSRSSDTETQVYLSRLLPMILWCVSGFIAGTVGHRLILVDVNNLQAASASALVALGDLPASTGYLIHGLVNTLGLDWRTGEPLASIAGIFSLAKLTLIPFIILTPVLFLYNSKEILTPPQRHFLLVAYFGFGSVAVLLVATTLHGPDLPTIQHTLRYLYPFLILILLANGMLFRRYSLFTKVVLVLTLVFVILAAPRHIFPKEQRPLDVSSAASSFGGAKIHDWRERTSSGFAVVDRLISEGLQFGYAPYWLSHTFTVQSTQRLKIRPINLYESKISPWTHLSSSRWYKRGYSDGKTFFLIPKASRVELESALDVHCVGAPDRVFEIQEYAVYVYAENPLYKQVNSNLDGSGKVCLSAQSLRQIGKLTSDGRLVAEFGSGSGLLHFGPYISLEKGYYIVIFDLDSKVYTDATELGYVEVVAESGGQVMAKVPIKAGKQLLEVPFSVTNNWKKNIEFRVYSNGLAQMSLNAIRLVRKN